MSPVSPLPLLVVMAVVVFTSWCITRVTGAPAAHGRYTSLDGLRGYLAVFVFLHHACIWYFQLQTGEWAVPPSRLYTNVGQGAVVLFFMITGFLFYSKILDGRAQGGVDWLRLYVSRVLRLVPMYLLTVLLIFIVVAALSGARVDGIPALLLGAFRWLTFTMAGAPDLNGVAHTKLIVAGVTWTLAYEWFFYLALPLLAMTVRLRVAWFWYVLAAIGVAGFAVWWPNASHLLGFVGGIAAAWLVRSERFCRFAETRGAALLATACIVAALLLFPTAYSLLPRILLAVAFCIIAGGSSLFGILRSGTSRTLGDMAYSIYLLHGILLFSTMHFAVGVDVARAFSPEEFWALICVLAPLLVLICAMTFRLVERPAMTKTGVVTEWLLARRAAFSLRRQTPAQ